MEPSRSRSKWMELPRKVVVGSGAVSEVADLCRALRLKDGALIVTGPTTGKVVAGEVSDLLEDGGFETETLVTEFSKLAEVEQIRGLKCY